MGLFWGCGYTYGFRVPFLVVSAYTPAGYVSGACGTQNTPPCGPQSNVPPYQHDFGSILAFIEYNFRLPIGGINLANGFPFADYYAPELQYSRSAIPLGDFFGLWQNWGAKRVRADPDHRMFQHLLFSELQRASIRPRQRCDRPPELKPFVGDATIGKDPAEAKGRPTRRVWPAL